MDINIDFEEREAELMCQLEGAEDHIRTLEKNLEDAYKGQEDFKRTIKELERKVEHLDDINKELLEEMDAVDESNDHLIYKNEELNHSNEYLVDRIEELKTEIQKLNRTIYLKDQIITTYRIEGAKLFHENEKLKKEIEEYESLIKIKE